MVRSFFGSPGAKTSRKERIEQAKQAAAAEKSRRRNFGFLKTGDKRMSTTSLNRTREHAKKLAMVYSDPVETPTNAQETLLNFGMSSDANDSPFDPFGTAQQQLSSPPKPLPASTRNTSLLDQHFSNSSEREFTASTQDSFDTASVGSAYDMDFLSSRHSNSLTTTPKKTRKANNRPSLGQYVEQNSSPFQQQQQQHAGSSFNDQYSRGSASKQERSVISMPTFPANSSMQASFARQNSEASSRGSNGAAARRRMRNQMRQHSSASSVSSVNSDADSYTSTPPESPASSSARSMSQQGRNRLAAYQGAGRPRIQSSGGSFYSQTSSGHSQQSSDPNLFDSDNDGGFTFDAFGLDQSQVERCRLRRGLRGHVRRSCQRGR